MELGGAFLFYRSADARGPEADGESNSESFSYLVGNHFIIIITSARPYVHTYYKHL